jgi:hypothetical protein
MNVRQALVGFLLVGVNVAASACDLPTLVAIPPVDTLGQDSPQVFVRVQGYVAGIKAYTDCIKAELAGAGSDAAPQSLRNQLVARNNAAVAEARAVLATFTERVAPSEDLYLAAFVAGESVDCMPTTRLQGTAVINDIAVAFIENNGTGYLNMLKGSCQDLEHYGKFDTFAGAVGTFAALGDASPVTNRTTRLCSNDFIEPYAFETTAVRSRQCALGRFFDLTAEEVVHLMQLRAAARPAAGSGSASPDAEAQETPAPRRSER